jgi:hypothetical protein
MPYIGLGLHVIIALCFAIHAVRTGRPMYWIMILFSAPLLGSIVYFFSEYLPDLRFNRTARGAAQAVKQFVDPDRELRDAQRAFDQAPTVGNRIRMAHALLGNGDAPGAAAQFRECAQGPFANDPDVLTGLAAAEFACGNAATAASTLTTLFEHHPARNTAAVALLNARVLSVAQPENAEAAFHHAVLTCNGPEPLIRYAQWLRDRGRNVDAGRLYEQIIKDAKHWPSHTRSLQKDWLRQARDGLEAVNAAPR